MNGRELEQAILALRETQHGRSLAASRTEERILGALEKRQPHASWLRWGLPMVAVCAVSSAFAATHPAVLRVVSSWISAAVTSNAKENESRMAPSPSAGRGGAFASDAGLAEEVAAQGDPIGEASAASSLSADPSSDAAAKVETAKARPMKTRFTAAPSASDSVTSEAPPTAKRTEEGSAERAPLEIFRAASRLHFSGRDRAGALAAWERYLAADPHGPLALEARYYRGLCLIDLGRSAEGKEALRPFAEGRYGSYRASEARRILNGLEAASP